MKATLDNIAICPARSLGKGDLIAREFLGGVISGRVTGTAFSPYELSEEQRAYMVRESLDIPEEKYSYFSPTQLIVFGEFHDSSNKMDRGLFYHMFLDANQSVAVFNPKLS